MFLRADGSAVGSYSWPAILLTPPAQLQKTTHLMSNTKPWFARVYMPYLD